MLTVFDGWDGSGRSSTKKGEDRKLETASMVEAAKVGEPKQYIATETAGCGETCNEAETPTKAKKIGQLAYFLFQGKRYTSTTKHYREIETKLHDSDRFQHPHTVQALAARESGNHDSVRFRRGGLSDGQRLRVVNTAVDRTKGCFGSNLTPKNLSSVGC